MPRRKAEVTVEDIIVSVKCPECHFPQPSFNYPGSFGWDGREVVKSGSASVACFKCKELFNIPASLLALVENRAAV
jgi:Zn finger protein HypA/HybF involved in hydrogenase expression